MRKTMAFCLTLLALMPVQFATAARSHSRVTDAIILRYRLQATEAGLHATGEQYGGGILHAVSTDGGWNWQVAALPKPMWAHDLAYAGALWVPPGRATAYTRVLPGAADFIPVFPYMGDGTYLAGTLEGAGTKPAARQVWRLLRADAQGDILFAVMSEKAEGSGIVSWWLARSGDGGRKWYFIAAPPGIPAANLMFGDTTPGYLQWLVTDYHFVRVDPNGYVKLINRFPDCVDVLALSTPTDTDLLVLWVTKPRPDMSEFRGSHSADGGQTWAHHPALPAAAVADWRGAVSMDFATQSFGVIVANTPEGCALYYTNDAGRTWAKGNDFAFSTQGGVHVPKVGEAVFLGTEPGRTTPLWCVRWTCDERLTDAAPIRFVAARKPVLSYVGDGPYRDVGVSPVYGTPDDQFRFKVRVLPPPGGSAAEVWLLLEAPDGATDRLTLVRESEGPEGSIWSGVVPGARFRPGETYRYHFTCTIGYATYIR